MPGGRGSHKQTKQRVSGRMAQLLAGELSVEDLDEEELARGQFRDEHGQFRGRPNKLIPRELQQEMIRRLLQHGDEIWRQGYNIAIRVHLEICSDPNNSPADRLKAAQYLIERVAGKTPDRIHIAAEDPVESLFRQILNDPKGLLHNGDGTYAPPMPEEAEPAPEKAEF